MHPSAGAPLRGGGVGACAPRPLCSALGALLLTLPAVASAGAEETLPPVLQAAFLAKILQHDATVQAAGLDATTVVLLTTPESLDAARKIAAALKLARLNLLVLELSEHQQIPAGAVVYLPPEGSYEAVSRWCAAKKALLVAPVAAPVRQGLASIAAIKDSEGRPKLLLHRRRLAEEGHELSAHFLTLVRNVD